MILSDNRHARGWPPSATGTVIVLRKVDPAVARQIKTLVADAREAAFLAEEGLPDIAAAKRNIRGAGYLLGRIDQAITTISGRGA
jgi:hypothetical protein